MALDTSGYRCRWVVDRLPLLAGGDLTGADRRKVERHLIGCLACRRHEQSLAGALGALQLVAAESLTVGADAPSLWPALARQIRESRHETRPHSWLDLVFAQLSGRASFERLRPVLVLASVLVMAGLTAAGVEVWVRWRINEARALIAGAALPVDADELGTFDFAPMAVAAPFVVPPLSGQTLVRDDAPVAPFDRTASRFDYDLDHGTPMGPDAHDVKASY